MKKLNQILKLALLGAIALAFTAADTVWARGAQGSDSDTVMVRKLKKKKKKGKKAKKSKAKKAKKGKKARKSSTAPSGEGATVREMTPPAASGAPAAVPVPSADSAPQQ